MLLLCSDILLTKRLRHCNIDFISISALWLYNYRRPTVFLYDMSCQWKHYIHRCIQHDNFPAHLRIDLPTDGDLRFVIPKYHFWGHKSEDYSRYSLNLVHGIGHTDGEDVECNW